MPTHSVVCQTRCYDSARKRRYYPGDQDDVDPLTPIAKYFKGFPDGTEVYSKTRGDKDNPPKETTIVVGGKPKAAPAADLLCKVCGEFTAKTERGLDIHEKACFKKTTEAAEGTSNDSQE